MIQGMYGAAAALDVASQAQDAIAQNLAQSGVPGYRSRGVAFDTFDRTLNSQSSRGSASGAQAPRTYSDFRPGAVQFTGGALDVALDGDGFFVMKGPQGPLYSRDGVFQRAANGQLQSTSGLPLQGEGGPIVIPAGASEITIGRDGTVRADKDVCGKIQLARFDDPNRLVPAGTTLFNAPAGVERQEGKDGVLQGYREASNVQPANEMVAMIRNSRYYEAAQRILRTISESVQLNTRPQ
jgi:flagellar basal body rod protein FlgG